MNRSFEQNLTKTGKTLTVTAYSFILDLSIKRSQMANERNETGLFEKRAAD